MTEDCKHPIFEYMGARDWGAGIREQRHRCIDCGHEERDVPEGSVMIGHRPGDCRVCDETAEMLPTAERNRWIALNKELYNDS